MRYKNVCYNCVRRKIKCDKHHPSCTHCSGIGLECTYDRTVRRNSTSRKAKDRRRGGTKGNIWSESEDDCVMELKRKRLNWEEISKHVPDRSTSACRQRYQYLVRERGEKGAPSSDKWLPEEDTRVRELRDKGIKWEDISKILPGRSATACRLHYQNYLIRRKGRDEEHKNKLAIRYERHKPLRASSSLNTDFGEPDRALAQVQDGQVRGASTDNLSHVEQLQLRQRVNLAIFGYLMLESHPHIPSALGDYINAEEYALQGLSGRLGTE
ncbi:uncharacterized protein FPOAC1_013046 [Fusarium poae]|uniref:uncharacterized protein n=1 Tax=Fusarium poae TaxID=36050 RepID=UPI001D056D75|nr:uncharacterized protein FPOAC1_013046 [Fusarium poae]KAG8665068.1 hypothetical protein FPOAC1_013046 [Fusarium poae]